MVFLETNVLLFVFSKGYDFSKISRGLLLLAGKALFAGILFHLVGEGDEGLCYSVQNSLL